MTNKYTYIDFAKEVIALVNGEIEVSPEIAERVTAKANNLIAVNNNRANTATHKAKGASPETLARANTIAKALTAEPMTATEINKKLNTEYTALQIANSLKYAHGVKSTKVIRNTVNAKGLKSEKEYTAYFIG